MSTDDQDLSTDQLDDVGEENATVEASTESDASVSVKDAERQRIQAQIEEFLNKGGQITQVGSSTMSDPPKRPESNYGGQPI
ncbi:hypothetical protein [Agarilytica rhodophyticola]|uniref:hypothetical protein n=1 Tax=Agarilytica rhodophyticola TaxID=1737490 RepID=UPI000B348F6E|nr:hypothetical protein [Agarilytica rhodophyticola]